MIPAPELKIGSLSERKSKSQMASSLNHHAMAELYKMRTIGILCDATLKLQDGFIKVHRAILSACSHYFKILFTTSLTTHKTNITIPGIRSQIMEKVIDYAYIRNCKIDETNVYEVLAIADYVAVLGLVKNCENFLISILNPENCIGIMIFGKMKFCKELYSKARLYVLRNFVEISVQSKEILKIGMKDFYDIISDDMLNSKEEEKVWECCLQWIEYDSLNRTKYISQLMLGVRLGLLSRKYFTDRVTENPFVINCEEAKPIIIKTLTFLYHLDDLSVEDTEAISKFLGTPRLPNEVIFAIGGWSEGHPQSNIETYDTRADQWIRVSDEDPAGPCAYHGTVVIGHQIYNIGGFNGVNFFNSCRVFDVVKKTWSEISPMHIRRCYVSTVFLDGYIYVMGGYDGHDRHKTVERYDPKTNQWTMLTSMSTKRSDASASVLHGKIYITGGFNGVECMNSVECYDPSTNSWSPALNMISRRSGLSCVVFKGFLYAIGGFNGLSRMNSCERFNPRRRIWTTIQEMYHPRSNFGIEIIDDMIFAIGGCNGTTTISHTECYDPEADEWFEANNMSTVRSGLSACLVKDLPNILDYTHKKRAIIPRMFDDDYLPIINEASRNIPVRNLHHRSYVIHFD